MDPFAGTGTTLGAAKQLGRRSAGMETDPKNASVVQQRVDGPRDADWIEALRHRYRFTENLDSTWPSLAAPLRARTEQMALPE